MPMLIDTHAHLEGEEFQEDLPQVIARAKEAGVGRVFLPAIHEESVAQVLNVCHLYPGYAYPMVGLIAVGEVGLDYYWSREYEREQLLAFEEQVKWAIELRLPLMIHCRKAQNEMVALLRPYEQELAGGVFHCFTGNAREAEQLLSFPGFVLGVGGVSTFKSSHLREDLPKSVPLDRLVLESDSPYMAPVPHRGQRNESAFVAEVAKTLALAYGVALEELATRTTANALRVFSLVK